MSYANAMLTIIALVLLAIVAKLYIPAAQFIGPQIALPTRGEVFAAQRAKSPSERENQLRQLRSRLPVVWVSGGEIDVSGSAVSVDGRVDVEGEVSIARSPY